MTRTKEFTDRGLRRIPGLTQLLSKRPDQFAPGVWPTYFKKAKGADVWDLDDRKFLDMSISGIGANILGYCDEEVDEAVIKCIRAGNSTSLNAPEEIELAELLCDIHPWAEKVRYARTGGEAMAIAVRIARASTGRDRVAFCGYHGWHDWYLAANIANSEGLTGHLLPGLSAIGVPKGLSGTALPFMYNNLDELEAIFTKYPSEVGAVIMEPVRSEMPKSGYLDEVKKIAVKHGALLIFDEVSSGFRLTSGGSHKILGVEPDIAVFAKAISNGYPMAAIIGKEFAMRSVEETFISSTYWTERIGPVAAIATIKKHQREDVSSHIGDIGKDVQKIWAEAADHFGVNIHISGINPMSHFSFEGKDSSVKMTLFVQEMLKHGILASNRFYANFSHTKEHVRVYGEALKKVFSLIVEREINGTLNSALEGGLSKPGFHRLN